MKRILLVFGTRPEAIKMAPLVKEFQKNPEAFETVICVTGQHRQMLDQVLEVFNILPDYDLEVMQQDQDLYDITSRVLIGMRNVLKEAKPDIVLVHGDTTTSIATALAGFYQQIPVGHIEAGLRTYNPLSPWPEEINRQLTSRIATLHFAPTETSKAALTKENIQEDKIFVTGNTVIDALYQILQQLNAVPRLRTVAQNKITNSGYNLDRLSENKKMILITGHRRENIGTGFNNLCLALKTLAESFPETDFVYPMHLNPKVRESIAKVFGKDFSTHKNVFFIEPLEYLSFVLLMGKAYIVLTDSGGIQEEAPGIGKPVLVLRDTTERPEAVEAGTVRLVGTDIEKIVKEVSLLLTDSNEYKKMSQAHNPYGDGRAAQRIVAIIKDL